MRIIGLSGASKSGKNTTSNYLRSVLQDSGQQVQQLSFAYRLKKVVCQVYGLSWDDVTKHKDIPHRNLDGKAPREVLQKLGTEGFRDMVSDNTWIDCVLRDICALYRANPDINVIITDVRFVNEAKTLRQELAACIVSVTRPGAEAQYVHRSEQELHLIREQYTDVLVSNSGTLRDLENWAISFCYEGLNDTKSLPSDKTLDYYFIPRDMTVEEYLSLLPGPDLEL
jgi:dephospho-CoA kinase